MNFGHTTKFEFMKQLLLELTPPPLPTLDNFVAGENEELLLQLRALLVPGASERFLYIWGEPGCGRSHLLRALVAAARERGLDTAYHACNEADGGMVDPQARDIVALDDIDRLSPQQQIAVFHMINRLRENCGAFLAGGPVPPAALGLRQDLVTRLGWGLVYQVKRLRDQDKEFALARHAAARGFRISEDIVHYLLRHGSRDMLTLMALLDALDRYSLQAQRPITVALLRELLHAGRASGSGP